MLANYLDESLALLYCEIWKLLVLRTQLLDLECHHFSPNMCVNLLNVINVQF